AGTATALDAARSSVAALRARFPEAVQHVAEPCGQAVVHIAAASAHDILAWLRDDPEQQFNYLTDITCVEYRDAERPFEVVYQLRSLSRAVDLRLKVGFDPEGDIEVATVTDLWAGADWL